jgi:hypothetical protein
LPKSGVGLEALVVGPWEGQGSGRIGAGFSVKQDKASVGWLVPHVLWCVGGLNLCWDLPLYKNCFCPDAFNRKFSSGRWQSLPSSPATCGEFELIVGFLYCNILPFVWEHSSKDEKLLGQDGIIFPMTPGSQLQSDSDKIWVQCWWDKMCFGEFSPSKSIKSYLMKPA